MENVMRYGEFDAKRGKEIKVEDMMQTKNKKSKLVMVLVAALSVQGFGIFAESAAAAPGAPISQAAFRTAPMPQLPKPGKGCRWITAAEGGHHTGSPDKIYKNYGRRDRTGRNDSAVIATIYNNDPVTYEHCGGQGWTRVVYQGKLGWVYGRPCGSSTVCSL